ncbi:hypothetical protein SAMD00079811_62190 [Scytonema sp. HK-05]|uniref:hypothetical protein n=1 Tax=Scytonema sp. HK-05 TaxID=1137095 RepID=UPI000935D514|nr:hypothetical protein NIES2130_38040 [Scytonema sp. HK-05]BAY48593.1 hypothetical protein SAMD00079811_62190 [Scytonema sp. HK-05]
MPFQENNKQGFVSNAPLDRRALQINLKPGLRERIMAIPDWKVKLREELEIWLSKWESQD